jgi:hypothetical protein
MRLPGLLLFTSLIFPLPDDFQGKVVSIADGDTVTVLRGREQVNTVAQMPKTRVDRNLTRLASPIGNGVAEGSAAVSNRLNL